MDYGGGSEKRGLSASALAGFAVAGICIPSLLLLYVTDFVFLASILGIVSYAALLPIVFLGLHMWANGRGDRWVNGPDWKKIPEDKIPAVASVIGKWLMVTGLVLLYAMPLVLYRFPTGLIVFFAMTAAAVAASVWPVFHYMKPANYSKIGFVRMDRSKAGMIAATMILISLPTVIMFDATADFGDGVDVTLGEDSFNVKAPMFDQTIAYADIDDITLDPNFDRGSRVAGFSTGEIKSGEFRNGEFGKYDLAMYTSCDSCIVVTVGGHHYAFNQSTEEETSALFDSIRAHIIPP